MQEFTECERMKKSKLFLRIQNNKRKGVIDFGDKELSLTELFNLDTVIELTITIQPNYRNML